MDTKELLKQYLILTGSNQQWIATKIGVSKTCINRYLSDKDDYIPTIEKRQAIHSLILEKINQHNELIK